MARSAMRPVHTTHLDAQRKNQIHQGIHRLLLPIPGKSKTYGRWSTDQASFQALLRMYFKLPFSGCAAAAADKGPSGAELRCIAGCTVAVGTAVWTVLPNLIPPWNDPPVVVGPHVERLEVNTLVAGVTELRQRRFHPSFPHVVGDLSHMVTENGARESVGGRAGDIPTAIELQQRQAGRNVLAM